MTVIKKTMNRKSLMAWKLTGRGLKEQWAANNRKNVTVKASNESSLVLVCP